MVDFEFEGGYANLPRVARRRGYRDVDRLVADSADLLLAVRAARTAFEAARASIAEWDAFAAVIRRHQAAAAPLRTLIAETQSRAAAWWRRAHARTHSRAAEEQR